MAKVETADSVAAEYQAAAAHFDQLETQWREGAQVGFEELFGARQLRDHLAAKAEQFRQRETAIAERKAEAERAEQEEARRKAKHQARLEAARRLEKNFPAAERIIAEIAQDAKTAEFDAGVVVINLLPPHLAPGLRVQHGTFDPSRISQLLKGLESQEGNSE